jgi:hypothetical protein
MLITADQLLCHIFGDYVMQSDYMATKKTSSSVAAAIHVTTYGLCFIPLVCRWGNITHNPSTWLPVSINWIAMLVICSTHFIIDRWRLARYVCWLKNFMAPKYIEIVKEGSESNWIRNLPWSDCSMTGYDKGKPPWMSVWLLIIADNAFHILFNGIALKL